MSDTPHHSGSRLPVLTRTASVRQSQSLQPLSKCAGRVFHYYRTRGGLIPSARASPVFSGGSRLQKMHGELRTKGQITPVHCTTTQSATYSLSTSTQSPKTSNTDELPTSPLTSLYYPGITQCSLTSQQDLASSSSSSSSFEMSLLTSKPQKLLPPLLAPSFQGLSSFTSRDLDLDWLIPFLMNERSFSSLFLLYIPNPLFQIACIILQYIASHNESAAKLLSQGIKALYSHFYTIKEKKIVLDLCQKISSWKVDKNLIGIPWTDAHSLISNPFACFFIKDGFAYIEYNYLPQVMADIWTNQVHEITYKSNISIVATKIIELAQNTTTPISTTPEYTLQHHHKMIQQSLPHFTDHNFYLAYSLNLKYFPQSSSSPSSSSSTNQQSSLPLSENFLEFAPPCILFPINKHQTNHTHLVNEERFQFFLWCYKNNVPLESVVPFWDAMVDADHTTKESKSVLKAYPKSMYLTFQKKGSSSSSSYLSCTTMGASCPFIGDQVECIKKNYPYPITGDIEDMAGKWFPQRITSIRRSQYTRKRSDSLVSPLVV